MATLPLTEGERSQPTLRAISQEVRARMSEGIYTAYRIRDWDDHFETAETRKLKVLRRVYFPNDHADEDYQFIMTEIENGKLVMLCWFLMCQVASKGYSRGLLAGNKRPHSAKSLSLITKCEEADFEYAFEVLSSENVGWLEKVQIKKGPDESGKHSWKWHVVGESGGGESGKPGEHQEEVGTRSGEHQDAAPTTPGGSQGRMVWNGRVGNGSERNGRELNNPPAAPPQGSARQSPARSLPSWEEVEKKLIDFGVDAVIPLIAQAKQVYTPSQALTAIDYAESIQATPNQLWSRLVNVPGNAPTDRGWITDKPKPSPSSDRYEALEEAQARSKRQTDREAAERKEAYTRRRQELEACVGEELDTMTETERDQLLSTKYKPQSIKVMTPEMKRTSQLEALFAMSKAQAAGG